MFIFAAADGHFIMSIIMLAVAFCEVQYYKKNGSHYRASELIP